MPELKVEFEELLVLDAPIEFTGFSLTDVDAIVLDEDAAAVEIGPLTPGADKPVARIGDVFRLGEHRLMCGDGSDPSVLQAIMGDDLARLVFTDQPYNVAIAGHVTGGAHREFAMASGEMADAQFRSFNDQWMGGASTHLMNGGILCTYIDWRGLHSVTSAAVGLSLAQINLVVWGKTNAGMGSLYRSQHELLPLFKKGNAAHVNNVDLGRKGRHRTNVWTYPGASTMGSDARRGLQHHPTVKPTAMLVEAIKDLKNRGDIVLDPFLGSGSTLIAAEVSGRICRGVELDPLYVDVIVRRFEKSTRHSATLEATKETFAELATRRAAEGIVTGTECERQ